MDPTTPPRPVRRPGPLPRSSAWRRVSRCVVVSVGMLARRDVDWPRKHVGRRIHFADGTAAVVYRETAVARRASAPCLLVVAFRLRAVRGRGHAWFRRESLLNTPLFVGFPGMVSKLWLAHDQEDRYRGLYEWDGPELAEDYARSLWRVLELVSRAGSIDYCVLPGVRRDQVLADPGLLDELAPATPAWSRPVGVT